MYKRKTENEYEIQGWYPTSGWECVTTEVSRKEAKAKGLSKGRLRAYKKQRIQDCVLSAFPHFCGWPKTKALAEDAYDSAAAFLCGIKLRGVKTT